MGIGNRIKDARELLNLSRQDLAGIIGVTPSAISNYENGISSPKEPVLFKLIEALRCDANYLFQDDMPEELLKLVVGHTRTTDTFGIYGHAVEGDLKRAADIFDNIFDVLLG